MDRRNSVAESGKVPHAHNPGSSLNASSIAESGKILSSDNGPCARIVRDLQKTYSKLRQYDVQYLCYVLVDAVTDRIPHIVRKLEQERTLNPKP